SPLKLLMASLPQLDACLAEADILFASRLVIHPTHETRVLKTLAALRQEAEQITSVSESYEEQHRAPQGELGWMGLGTDEEQVRFAKNAGFLDQAKINRALKLMEERDSAAEKYNAAHLKWVELMERGTSLVEEFRFGHLISQLDARRKALMIGLDETQIDIGKVKEAESQINGLLFSLDTDLNRL